ncbi:hypothetical protein OM255_19090, partial [Escherichia albertii]|nr:hypothetical protein [Escherichia albertii]MCZ8698523.1 hypothetical protein [Escherichia albertii]MCZ8719997.1 hypothetical protein [Escherichia albertii]MCZ8750532.1 hypothetical protein [Escherichia albertii]MCZ8845934.1 hypothetical protein [Escherichia albertii]
MSKLFQFKSWLTIEETANRLSTTLGERVSVADCLQLAVEGHITISAILDEGRYAIAAQVIKNSQRRVFEKWIVENTNEGAVIRTPAGDEFYTNEQLDYEYEDIERVSDVFRINHGIYDLPMVGAESLDVMHEFDLSRDKVPREFHNMEGAFLLTEFGLVNILNAFNEYAIKSDENGKPKLYDKESQRFVDFSLDGYHPFFYPADGLGNVEFVFRKENIAEFEKKTLSDNNSLLNLDESLLL